MSAVRLGASQKLPRREGSAQRRSRFGFTAQISRLLFELAGSRFKLIRATVEFLRSGKRRSAALSGADVGGSRKQCRIIRASDTASEHPCSEGAISPNHKGK